MPLNCTLHNSSFLCKLQLHEKKGREKTEKFRDLLSPTETGQKEKGAEGAGTAAQLMISKPGEGKEGKRGVG